MRIDKTLYVSFLFLKANYKICKTNQNLSNIIYSYKKEFRNFVRNVLVIFTLIISCQITQNLKKIY